MKKYENHKLEKPYGKQKSYYTRRCYFDSMIRKCYVLSNKNKCFILNRRIIENYVLEVP